MTEDSGAPFGCWVKHLDGLLDQAFDQVLARRGMRRRHWHVLSTLREGPLTRAEITEALLAFWVAASVTQADVVDDLVRRGWADLEGETYRLTPDGRAAHRAVEHDVRAVHGRVAEGFAADEFDAVLDALARMCANLERALSDRKTRPDQEH